MNGKNATRLFPTLRNTQQRGSKPRCHLLTHGTREEVARRLTTLISPWGTVAASDRWMPSGFASATEAQLHVATEMLPDSGIRESLLHWWLAVRESRKTTTPNWDIASTCMVGGAPGIILIEAKAHDAELRNEERGKPLIGEENKGVSFDSRRNHVRIGASIQEAGVALTAYTALPWAISRDWNYQMSNRFAWAFKVAELGIPVILIYLGFTGCEEMRQGKTAQRPIADSDDWHDLVLSHSRPLFPAEVWNQEWKIKGASLIPLIKTYEQPLGGASSAS